LQRAMLLIAHVCARFCRCVPLTQSRSP
jgi:hypothetical protein